jgi:arylsulfatase A-like enzyme
MSLEDAAPTLLELTGVSARGRQFSGRSLVPLLHGRRLPQRPLFSDFVLSVPEQAALIQGGWKYVLRADSTGDELYQVDTDPRETTNQITRHPGLAAQMRRTLAQHIREQNQRFRAMKYDMTRIDQSTYDSLKSLGYVQ